MSDLIPVNEIFHSIQGEGITAGTNSLFVRLQGCPVGCSWCDTKYTWKSSEITESTIYSKWGLINVITALLSKNHCNNIIFTGGEPLIHWANLYDVITEFRIKINIEIETSGIIFPDRLSPFVRWNISPKLSNSRVKKQIRYKKEVLMSFISLEGSIFKFVVSDYSDIQEIQKDFNFIPRDKIWLMPLGEYTKNQLINMPKVWEIALKNGYNFSPRLHTIIFSNKRGV